MEFACLMLSCVSALLEVLFLVLDHKPPEDKSCAF